MYGLPLLVEINQNKKFKALSVKDDGKNFDTQKQKYLTGVAWAF